MKFKLASDFPHPGDTAYLFQCPGCGSNHFVTVARQQSIQQQPCWEWNGDVDKPTVSPSIHVTDWRTGICHSFIKDGMIQFLSDCTHELAGQTVEIPEWE